MNWMSLGQSADAFWSMTLREVVRFFDAEIMRFEREVRLTKTHNYGLAQLIALAVNSPKNLPNIEDYLGDEPSSGDGHVPATEGQLLTYFNSLT